MENDLKIDVKVMGRDAIIKLESSNIIEIIMNRD